MGGRSFDRRGPTPLRSIRSGLRRRRTVRAHTGAGRIPRAGRARALSDRLRPSASSSRSAGARHFERMSTPAPDARSLLDGGPQGYVERRDALAKALRTAGDRDAAAAVKALSKPTLAWWAVLAAG